MSGILDLVFNHPTRQFQAGDLVIEQGHDTGVLLVLLAGEVEILRDGVFIARSNVPGAVFGEMGALLATPHTATVRALAPSSFAVVDDARGFLAGSTTACFHVAELLARRLDALNKYLIDVQRQYEGHDHLGMVDEVLETLMHRQPRKPAH